MSPKPLSSMTEEAVQLIGTRIRQARIERGWTQDELAGRSGVTTRTVGNVEKGSPSVAIGTVFELATIVGLQMFASDRHELSQLIQQARQRLDLLPDRVRNSNRVVHDDF